MAQGSSNGEEDLNDIVSSHSLAQRQRLTGILTCPQPQLPTLPFDLLPEILCRLPVKLLVQLRCLCKFFNSLISDPKFAKKHLQFSTKRHHLMLRCIDDISSEWLLFDSPIPSIFSTSNVVTQTQLYPPNSITCPHNFVCMLGSCDGIFCGTLKRGSYFLWNPSIRKFKLLPPLENHKSTSLNFGYDHFIDNYKVIVVSSKNEVCINTMGTDYWRRIDDFPDDYHICGQGVFVSGTVNWLPSNDSSMYFILSLDLEKESYQQLLLPDYEIQNFLQTLGVVRDCLCVFASSDMFLDVWIMNEYGKKDSWSKLYSVPNMQDRSFKACTITYISEDDQLLVGFVDMRRGKKKLVVYDSKTSTLNIPEFQNNYEQLDSNVYIESLISP